MFLLWCIGTLVVDSVLAHVPAVYAAHVVSSTQGSRCHCLWCLDGYWAAEAGFPFLLFVAFLLLSDSWCSRWFAAVIFFAQRTWFFLWEVTQFSDSRGEWFTCHIVLFVGLRDCTLRLLSSAATGSTRSFSGTHRYVFFSVSITVSRRPSYTYCDARQCVTLAALAAIQMLCLELHCLGSEVLQQTRIAELGVELQMRVAENVTRGELSSLSGRCLRGGVPRSSLKGSRYVQTFRHSKLNPRAGQPSKL